MTSPDFASVFAEAEVDGFIHALDLDSGNEVGYQDADYVIPASVFKIPVLLELFRQHEAGEIDVTSVVEVPVTSRTGGPFGISIMQDPISMSLRDLAWLMIGISDNAATDFICDQVGIDQVNATLASLGFEQTTIAGHCEDLFADVRRELGVLTLEEIARPTWEMFEKVSEFDPSRAATRTTPREMTRLLQVIWTDEGPLQSALVEVRRILGQQVWPHRLASGFADLDEVTTSGKTGTLPTIRNEVGVVAYPDGGRYAVAVFTRAKRLSLKHPAADAVIGRSARLAVDALRAQSA
ncbi:MAG TPA: serine hydrolase [Mycobacteriales bacterium]|nr:serine hydrolase [Mycobacteriales bacterium]